MKTPVADMQVLYFAAPAELRDWFALHASTETELMVGFMKRGTGAPSMTWPEAVDEALCVGWIDGVRYGVDENRYKIRFTVRKATSTWSAINIDKMSVLTAEGRVQPAGLAAFAQRSEKKSRIYAYEQPETSDLSAAEWQLFDQHGTARQFFEAQPPGYRKQMLWRVTSAKQEATRLRRLLALIAASEAGARL
ncbi:MAG: YdeI/OmpD-associated family protein [Pseudomonadota bacterium]